jgi:DNA-binding NarL/FixJ family response regulator
MPITVCIVEDDPDLRETIGGYVAGAKIYTCLGAFATGEAALQSIPSLKPDIVLMDINLPGMNGIQCVKKLKEKMPKLLVMMLTVYENSDRIFEALSAGASGYLLKSTPPEKLLEAIEDLRGGGSPMSSNIARKVVQAFHPSSAAAPLIEKLSPREQQVLNYLAEGCSYKQIAAEMNLSMGTIRTYIRSMYEKLHVNSRTEAVVKYLDATGMGARVNARG